VRLPGVQLLAGVEAAAMPGAAGAGHDDAAMLDKDEQNVPRGASARPVRVAWSGKHYRVRNACRDFLLWAEGRGLNVFFLTLTSAPGGNRDRLRKDFQAFRKRLARKLQLEASDVSYCGVDTTEGHGVLHMLVTVPPGKGRSARFLCSVEWIRDAWVEIHGAKQLRIVPVRRGAGSARRLSSYLVSQYVAGQDALVRLSRSRNNLISGVARRAFFDLVFRNPRRWLGWTFYGGTQLETMRAGLVSWGPQWRLMRGHWWRQFREGWESYVLRGRAEIFGREYCSSLCGGFEAL